MFSYHCIPTPGMHANLCPFSPLKQGGITLLNWFFFFTEKSEIEKQRGINEKLRQTIETYDLPTVDDYINRKLVLLELEKMEKIRARKANLKRLELQNKTSLSRKSSVKSKEESSPFIYKGPTFDLCYKMPKE